MSLALSILQGLIDELRRDPGARAELLGVLLEAANERPEIDDVSRARARAALARLGVSTTQRRTK